MTLFNYDWFTGEAFKLQREQASRRCGLKKFPDLAPDQADSDESFTKFVSELEIRTLIYLRDGFSYEMKERVDLGLRSNLMTFECEPVDEQYKVGSFLVSVPFEEIVRVEVFAVHPSEKPEDVPVITGFRSGPADMIGGREEMRDPGRENRDPTAGDGPPSGAG